MSKQIHETHQSNGSHHNIGLQDPSPLWNRNSETSTEQSTIKLISHYNKQLFEYYLNLTEAETD